MLRFVVCAALVGTLSVSGCSSVPKESVELSYQVGQDISALQRTCSSLVQQRFAEFRQRRIDYLEQEWVPLFLENWVSDGKLIEVARGELVWSDEADDFVAPTPGSEHQQLLATVHGWSRVSHAKIGAKRRELLGPLDSQEAQILLELDRAFDRMTRANAHITAQLNSLRKVKEVQNQALESIGARETVEALNDRLIGLSDDSEQGLEKVRKADGQVDELGDNTDGGND